MGHYASEMMCNKCGNCRCTCPPKKEPAKGAWVFDCRTFKAIKAVDLIAKKKKPPKKATDMDLLNHYIVSRGAENSVYWMEHFNTKKQAQAAADKYYNKTLADHKTKLSKLEKISQTYSSLEKLEVYEKVLHQIQMNAEVTMDHEKLKTLIGLICGWSYAHRSGNGEYSDDEQQAMIDQVFQKLNDFH
jgi:hypothetical protein